MRFSFTRGIVGSQLSGRGGAGQLYRLKQLVLPRSTSPVLCVFGCPDSCCSAGRPAATWGQKTAPRGSSCSADSCVSADTWTRTWPKGYPRRMARGKDFAVGGFWLVSLIIFIAGQQQRLYLPQRDKHKADPLFYTGIVLISIGGLLVVCYFNRDTCQAEDVGPTDRAASGSQRV